MAARPSSVAYVSSSRRPRGRRRAAGLFAGLLLIAAGAVGATEVVYLFSDGQMPVTVDALRQVRAEHPAIGADTRLHFITESVFDDVDVDAVQNADVLVLDIMNQQMLERFNETHGIDLIKRIDSGGVVLAVGQGLQGPEYFTAQGALWDSEARAYWANSGVANHAGLLKRALTLAGVEGLTLEAPVPALDFAYYYPSEQAGGGTGRIFASWEEFDRWRVDNDKLAPGKPRVALAFYRANYYTGDTAAIDALITEIERQGAEAIPFFGYPGAVAFERMLIDEAGDPRADVAVSLLFRFADFNSAQTLELIDIPVVSLITLYGRSEDEWRSSASGLSIFEGTFQVAVPELAGLVAPTVIGSRERVLDRDTGLTVIRTSPVETRLGVAVERALAYARLRGTPNEEKRLALVYYNYPPGKAGIGASYLNVAESLSTILGALRDDGYDVGAGDLSTDAVLERVLNEARNVAGYAPGELKTMLAAGEAVRIPLTQYERWLAGLAPALQQKIAADWGRPEDAELMLVDGTDGPEFVIPWVRFGNVALMPQPARGWGEDDEALYHADDLAPHHQYVAAYEWLKREFRADAVVHMGTHGTLEWLDGKDIGQSREDATDALLGSLPDIYVYNVDVVGEGLVARRRGMATLVDHMVPPFTEGGLYAELALLEERMSDYHNNIHKNPELAERYAAEIVEQLVDLGIAKDLGLDVEELRHIEHHHGLDHDLLHSVQDYMVELRSQNIPYGLHAFGRVPDDEARVSTVDAIVNTDRSLLPDEKAVFADDMHARIERSGSREVDNLLAALNGGFIPVGSGGEPIRNPDAYPTGKNFYGIDPDKVPKPAAYALGVELADRLLAGHVDENGDYPEKVSFVIWGDETMRHEGIVEAQVFHLLGTRPVWNERGKVVDIEVVPREELGRPRVDIVIASAAEGMFNNVTLLMDKAVQTVKAIDEPDNYVRAHYLAAREALVEAGYEPDDADRRAGVRIFDEPPGTYNLNTSRIVEASGTWETDAGIGHDYIQKMGHGFGNGFWGEPMADAFRMALSGTETVVHSSSTMLYGALDNDDFYMYMGGLTTAIRNVDGEEPDLVVTNTRDPGNPKMSSIDEFIGLEFRSRYVNPRWIEGMKKEGYAGAAEMRAFVENLWGWEATVGDAIDDQMWQETFDVYVEDKHELGLESFFASDSPFAFQDMSARMIETVRKGHWNADPTTQQALLRRYVDSVMTHGAGCSETTCGNPLLMQYVVDSAEAAGIPAADVSAFRTAIETATESTIETMADEARQFVAANEARLMAPNDLVPPEATPPTIESIELQQHLDGSRDTTVAMQEPMDETDTLDWRMLALGALLLLSVLGFGALRGRTA